MPSIGQTWVLASIGAVVEMGVLISTIETTANMESSIDNAFYWINPVEKCTRSFRGAT
jgi:hypothetical protein